jgi:hypothetical protein
LLSDPPKERRFALVLLEKLVERVLIVFREKYRRSAKRQEAKLDQRLAKYQVTKEID